MTSMTELEQLRAENESLRQRLSTVEEPLKEQHDLMQLVVMHNPNAIAVFDKDLHYMAVSERYIHDYHIAGQEVIGRHHYDVFPEMPQKWRDVHRRCLEGAIERSDEDSFVRQDGSVDYNRWECRPWYDAQGNIAGIITFTEVITERKRTEYELRAAEARYHSIHENAPVGIFRTTGDGRFIDANPALAKILNYPSAQELIETVNVRTLYETPEHRDEIMHRMYEEEGTVESEILLRRKDGSLMVGNLHLWRTWDYRETVLCVEGFLEDITERKQAEEERTALQEQIIEAQRSALLELSSPLIPLSEIVLLLPLIGTIDSSRAQQILETLLEGVARQRAEHVIVDITGMQVVDTQVANVFVQTTRAVRLLGARVVITGVQPQIAQTLVYLGMDLSGIVTCSTLERGIRYAMGQ